MKNIFSRYVSQFDWSKIMDELVSKLISLAFLFVLFFLAKKLIHSLVKRILKPSLNYVGQDEARKNTILRLVESLLNYCLYFILIYWIIRLGQWVLYSSGTSDRRRRYRSFDQWSDYHRWNRL